MAQNYYSKRTVEKLKAQAHCAEQNFASTLADNEKLGAELSETKQELGRVRELLDKERMKSYDLEVKLGLRNASRDGCAMKAAEVKRTAVRRAHEELHKVKPTEANAQLLHRAIGNAQGILAAAIDANAEAGEMGAQSISLYPDDEKAGRERNPMCRMRGGY